MQFWRFVFCRRMPISLSALGDSIVAFTRDHQNWLPFVVFMIGFVKSLAIVSILVPGVVILVGIGALAAVGGFALWPLVLADGFGAVLGYALSYWAGRYWSSSILTSPPLSNYPDGIARAEAFFVKYGTLAVFFGHFFGPVRAFIAIVAGVAKMPQLPFQMANIISGFLWSAGVLAPGYYGVSTGILELTLNWFRALF